MGDILYKEECYEIQGAIFRVNKELGSGFLEAVYQECLEKEFTLRNIPYQTQVQLDLVYRNLPLNQKYYADLICYDKIIIEIKAVSILTVQHAAQLMNYLKITGLKLGLLVNFCNYPKAEIKRIIVN